LFDDQGNMMNKLPVEARLSATVVLLRDTDQGLQTLLLRRNPRLKFAAGSWVFPGGAVDQIELDRSSSQIQAIEAAAIREVYEECGLSVTRESLVHFCRWTTPEGEKKRFATWFFVAPVGEPDAEIIIDNGEIHEYQWVRPVRALALHGQGRLDLMPPAFLTLSLLSHYQTVEAACVDLAQRELYSVTPKLSKASGQMAATYPGDVEYETGQGSSSGPQHRTIFTDNGMKYIHSGADVSEPPMDRPLCCGRMNVQNFDALLCIAPFVMRMTPRL
jgi:8-oxo-dGTP pyrophosphatase MutT (NUDIX family)